MVENALNTWKIGIDESESNGITKDESDLDSRLICSSSIN